MAILIESFRLSATKTAGIFYNPVLLLLRGRAHGARKDALAPLDQESEDMMNLVGRTLYRLRERLPGRVSTPNEDGCAAATAIWSKQVGRMPRAVAHCQTGDDVRSAICAARDCGLPLSVRGGVSR
jgi:hypothetical protein